MELTIAPVSTQRTDKLDLLPPVFIPIIDYGPQNGLNHYDLFDIGKPVILTIVTRNNYRQGAIINLYWDNQLITTRELNEEDVKNTTIGMSVPPVAISAPLGIVYYTVFHPLTDLTETSESRTVLVNILIPGDPDPDNTTPNINENLSKAEGIPEVIDAGAANGLEVTIAPWCNMEAGDVLTLYWGGTQQRVQNPPLHEDQLDKPQVILVDKDTIAAAGDRDNLIVNYDIRDSVNNWSLKSLPALTNVDIGGNTLAAPRVIDAVEGVIDLAILATADVRVQLPAYTGIAINDDVTLHWQGETLEGVPALPFTVTKTLNADDVNFPPMLEVPNAFATTVAGGRATVSYEVDTAGSVRNSRKVSVEIKGVAAQLAPPTIAGAVGDQLALSAIPEQGAEVFIPAYTGMVYGDQVLLTWRGRTAQGQDLVYTNYISIGKEEVGQPVVFTVPKSFATALENSVLMLSYRVVLFSNGAMDSPIAEFKVSAGAGGSLPAPTVDNAPADVFDPDTGDGTMVRMSSGLVRDDEATLFWGTPGQPGALSRAFRIAIDNQSVQWAITAEQIEVFRNQVLDVYYQVNRGGVPLESVVRKLTIATGEVLPAPTLPKPTVNGTVDDVLDPALIGAQAYVRVDYDDEMPGDTVTVTWTGSKIPAYSPPPQQPGQQSQALEFTVPEYYVNQNEGAEVIVSYTVARNGSIYQSATYLLTIKTATPELSIDTSELALNGRILRHDRVPTNPPANSYATRPASGGKPPYVYSAADRNCVDVNPSTGEVIAHTNGQTTVTVTDADGEHLSYPVSVTNALKALVTSQFNAEPYNVVVIRAQQKGGHVPSLEEFNELRATYGGSPAIEHGDAQAWTTSSGGAGKNATMAVNSGATGAQSSKYGVALGWAVVPAN